MSKMADKRPSQLKDGKIPVGAECPYKEACQHASICTHKGKSHAIEFSCGTARAFDLFHRMGDGGK